MKFLNEMSEHCAKCWNTANFLPAVDFLEVLCVQGGARHLLAAQKSSNPRHNGVSMLQLPQVEAVLFSFLSPVKFHSICFSVFLLFQIFTAIPSNC